MRGQGLNDLPRCELERRSSHHKGIFFEVPGLVSRMDEARIALYFWLASIHPIARIIQLVRIRDLIFENFGARFRSSTLYLRIGTGPLRWLAWWGRETVRHRPRNSPRSLAYRTRRVRRSRLGARRQRMSSFSDGHGAQERRGAGRAIATAIEPHHMGLCSGFINEDKMLRLQMRLQAPHSSRAVAISARSCSAARNDFFECQPEMTQPFPRATDADLHLVLCHEPGLQFSSSAVQQASRRLRP